MSTFSVSVVTVRGIESIPDADRIELAVVGDYRSVIKKGQVQVGEKVAYLPEAAVLPECLLRHIGLWDENAGKGRLAGSRGNRIKAAKLRGMLSQGIVLPLVGDMDHLDPEAARALRQAAEGDDLAEALGVVKYIPPIPESMDGDVRTLFDHTIPYDIEDRKRHPDILQEGEQIALTEKLHGTFCVIGYVPGLAAPDLFHGGDVYVSSKGISAQGLVFIDTPRNEGNIYVQQMRKLTESIQRLASLVDDPSHFLHAKPVHIMGEVFGEVQDLKYGLKGKHFRAFDVYVGTRYEGRYLNVDEKRELLADLGIQTVDFLYVGPYSREVVLEYAGGMSVTGNGANIREGVVITPLKERSDPRIGRVILKAISEAYLTRKSKHATEYN